MMHPARTPDALLHGALDALILKKLTRTEPEEEIDEGFALRVETRMREDIARRHGSGTARELADRRLANSPS